MVSSVIIVDSSAISVVSSAISVVSSVIVLVKFCVLLCLQVHTDWDDCSVSAVASFKSRCVCVRFLMTNWTRVICRIYVHLCTGRSGIHLSSRVRVTPLLGTTPLKMTLSSPKYLPIPVFSNQNWNVVLTFTIAK